MTLRQIEVFFVVAEELHFGRAAKRLHVAQPAVSQTIRALEEELGTPLFDRTRRSTQLTDAGVVFLKESQDAVRRLQQAKQMARQVGEGERGHLLLGLTTVSALTFLPSAILLFQERYPNVVIRVEQMGTMEQCRALSLGELDVGFSVLIEEVKEIASEALTQEPLTAILPESHPLAGADTVELRSLLQEPMILLNQQREPTVHRAYRRLCEAHGCEPNVILELDHLEATFAFVAVGMGVSLVPASAMKLRFDGVVGRPVVPAHPAGTSFLWNPRLLTPVSSNFLSLIRSMRDAED